MRPSTLPCTYASLPFSPHRVPRRATQSRLMLSLILDTTSSSAHVKHYASGIRIKPNDRYDPLLSLPLLFNSFTYV